MSPCPSLTKELKVDGYFDPSRAAKETRGEHQRMMLPLSALSRTLFFPPFVSRQKVGKRNFDSFKETLQKRTVRGSRPAGDPRTKLEKENNIR